jgi:hypothetical protein
MAHNLGIVVATSIHSTVVRHESGRDVGQQYQSHCIESWIGAGFRVLSLNFPDEISELAPRYPNVQFIALKRDDGARSGRTPLLSELLNVLAGQDEDIVGIINADILLEEKDWTSAIVPATKGAIAVAQRVDMKSFEDRNQTPYPHGFDLFFFERREIPAAIERPFAMGLPWWDYYLPIAFSLRRLRINLLTAPVAFHLQHPTSYSMPVWRKMAREFAEFVVESVNATPGSSAAQNFPAVIRLCRRVAAEPAIFEDIRAPLLARTWGRVLTRARRLPPLRRLINEHHGQDANQHRLSEACVAAISASPFRP